MANFLKVQGGLNVKLMRAAVLGIKSIHIYDFDNTLFSSPLPNPQLWSGPTIGRLQNPQTWANGVSWWHDPAILSSTGKGMDAEEQVAWKGWWNESQARFADVITRIIKAKGLSFDMICLKPDTGPSGQTFTSTIHFKQALLDDIMLTYTEAEEIRVYEDRPRHVEQFRDYFRKFNRRIQGSRKPISEKVIEVAEITTYLDPVAEAAEVQRMVNSHNLAVSAGIATHKERLKIKRSVFFTGYLIGNDASARLIKYVLRPLLPPNLRDLSDLKVMANSILITPRPASEHILNKVGGIGKVVKWRITGVAAYDKKLWAARVTPTNEDEVIHTENPEPCIILGMRKNARPADVGKIRQWQPVSPGNALVFEAVVGHRTLLRIEEEKLSRGSRSSDGTEVFKGTKRSNQQATAGLDRSLGNSQAQDVGNRGYGQPFMTGPHGSNMLSSHRGHLGGRAGIVRGGRHNQAGTGRMPNKGSRGRGGHFYQGYRSLDDSKEQQSIAGNDMGYNLTGLDY
ncbi:hypothetical protein KEM54_000148 [Ascosphaera aggregata]|nr:hypothetical protein KEM54_000148 [Ascosphaera aggregata]